MVPCRQKHVRMFGVILWYKYLRNSSAHFVGWISPIIYAPCTEYTIYNLLFSSIWSLSSNFPHCVQQFLPTSSFTSFANTMEKKTSWEANSLLASQEITRVLLRNPNVPDHTRKSPPPVPVLSQTILQPTPKYFKWSPSFMLPHKTLCASLFSPDVP